MLADLAEARTENKKLKEVGKEWLEEERCGGQLEAWKGTNSRDRRS